jgi:hypothetical protein
MKSYKKGKGKKEKAEDTREIILRWISKDFPLLF